MLKPQRKKRKARIRAKISGTASMPRLSVFRSNKFTYAQLIDDSKGTTLVSVTNKTTKGGGTKSDAAEILGTQLASLAKKKKIERIVFDRSGYAYHGRIKRLADAARAGGLKF